MYQSSAPVIDTVMPRRARWNPKETRVVMGSATGDITPPIGIRAHNWGAARGGQATGVHRPLEAGALAFQDPGGGWRYMVTADLGWWRGMADFTSVFAPVAEALDTDSDHVLLHLIHTHSGPTLAETDPALPGSEHIEPYRRRLVETLAELCLRARESSSSSTITWAYGRCSMAVVRDLPCGSRYVVGFNPDLPADDTVVVGRVVHEDGDLSAVLVNYACHPTTLAHENSLLSPDYVGATREVVQTATGAPVFFFQGASGELSPREQYTPGTELADRHGRSLGHAVLSTLENMGTPSSMLEFAGVVESGAPLGIWVEEAGEPADAVSFEHFTTTLDCRPAVTEDELSEQWAGIDPLAAKERVARAARRAEGYRVDGRAEHPVWVWSLGDAVIVAHPGEAFSLLQTELRRRHPDRVIMVLNLTNGPGFMYLPPRSAYDNDQYQVWQSLLAAGSLERVIEAADAAIVRLGGDSVGTSS